jgi:hypothetical protein
MANDYAINYDDERFGQVESDKKQALTELENTYGGMINDSDKYYQAQIDASKQWADKQTQLQQEQTDFAIEKVEQQKEQAHKDYLKEQSGAYVDWQKQSNEYGAEAEKMASAGLANTGFSESSQVSMYNTYQNRVAMARDSYTRAVLNYDNAIKDARLQNNAALAEIAFKTLQEQLKLSLEGFQYKNNLLMEKTNKKTELDNIYHQRYQDVLNQINTENALAEEIRQYNEQMAFEREQFKWQKEQAEARSSGGGGRSSSSPTPKATLDDNPVDDNTGDGDEMTDNRLDLGRGPLTDATLAKMISSGHVDYKVSGNHVDYRWSGQTKKEQQLLAAQEKLDNYTWTK